MTYQVLARKWRPRNFKEMAGQTHVLQTLINALDNNRLHHAYLFTGTRGVGKTTIARILARCLNCEKGVTSTPCGECSACVEINEGRFIDLIEVDAASRTKVEDTRELLENVQYAPSRGRYKVYLIDEVHMLSTHSFNALLKTLEEPPPHVKFLLATTDPHKLPITVLSRCLQFNLKNLTPERLVEHINHILRQEQIEFEEGALWQLGRAAQGSVRDCLTLLDQAISFCNGTITDAGVREFLGNIDRSVIVQLMDALIAQDAAALLGQVATVAEHSPDFAVILQELLSWLHRVAIAQVVPDGIDNSQGDRAQILQHAAQLPAETVQLFYQLALKGREDMPFALDARSGLEMTLLRMLAFTPAGIPKVPQASLPSRGVSENLHNPDMAPDSGQKKKSVAEPAPAPQFRGANLHTGTEALPAFNSSEPDTLVAVAIPASVLPVQARQEPPQQAQPVPPASLQTSPTPVRPGSLSLAASECHSAPVLSAPRVPECPMDTQTHIRATQASHQSTQVLPSECVDAAEPAAPKMPLADLRPAGWIDLFRALPLTGVSRSIAANSVLNAVSGNQLTLLLQESQATLFNDEHRKRIEAALSAYFEVPVMLQMTVGQFTAETPSAWRQRHELERRQAAVRCFTEDAVVQAVVERFGAHIQHDTITPLTPTHW